MQAKMAQEKNCATKLGKRRLKFFVILQLYVIRKLNFKDELRLPFRNRTMCCLEDYLSTSFELNSFSLFLNPTDFLYLYCEYFRYVLLGGLDFSPLYSIRTRTRSILTGQCSPCPCSSCRVHCSQICSIKADEEQGRNNSKFKLFRCLGTYFSKEICQ